MLNINYRDGRPVYQQIKDGLRTLIVTGAIQPDGRMRSVRELAQELAINPNTIQRAYRELESEGYIYSVPGKGSFAGEKREVGSERLDELLRLFDETVRELFFLGVTRDTLCNRIMEGISQ